MSPPYLSGYAPIFDVIHPFVIDALPICGNDACPPLLHSSDCLLCQRAHLDKPLLGEEGFNHCLAAVAVPHRMAVRLDLFKLSSALQILQDLLAAFEPIHVLVRPCQFVHSALFVDHLYSFKPMGISNFKVVGVMGRGDLQGPGSKFRIHVCIKNDGYRFLEHWQKDIGP